MIRSVVRRELTVVRGMIVCKYACVCVCGCVVAVRSDHQFIHGTAIPLGNGRRFGFNTGVRDDIGGDITPSVAPAPASEYSRLSPASGGHLGFGSDAAHGRRAFPALGVHQRIHGSAPRARVVVRSLGFHALVGERVYGHASAS